ncbi:MAG: rod shape-determining protein MreC [Holosporaceae bacterium]|jgi:rod shape-determining protein MreC|nr:rod shape-determining protein MreC [Holosporaceae bacterium]
MRNNKLKIKEKKNRQFSLFKRSQKRKIFGNAMVCIATLFFLHNEVAQKQINRLKARITSLHVATYAMVEQVRETFSNLHYFLFKNVDGILFDLRSENLKLCLAIKRLKNLRSENENLRRIFALKQIEEPPITVAKVVTIFSNDFARSAILDSGTSQNVAPDDIVMDDKGLIGRIVEASDNWSRALLITDVNSIIPVKINGVNAMLSGGNSNKLQITIVQEDVTFQDGDMVETSGYGNVFVEKIPVGKVKMEGGKAFVTPFVDFNSLKYVAVIKNSTSPFEGQ